MATLYKIEQLYHRQGTAIHPKRDNIQGGPKTGTLFVRINFICLNFIKY